MTSRNRFWQQFAVLTVVMFTWCFVLFPASLHAETVDVQTGTRVMVTFPQEISPLAATVGQRLTLVVASDVKVSGVTVIRAGAPVIAEVTQAQKKGAVGKPDIIAITLYSVEAVDGTSIPLSGQKYVAGEDKQTTALVITILCCVLGLIMKGGSASIAAGSQVEGTIAGTTKVSA